MSWTDEEMAGVAEQHHVESIMSAPDDFDAINDRENFERLIYDIGNHYISVESKDFYKFNQPDTIIKVEDKLAGRLVNFSKSWDLYGHRDAYDSDEQALDDARQWLREPKQIENVYSNILEDFEENFGEPSAFADRITTYKKETGKESSAMDIKQEKNGQMTFDFSKPINPEYKTHHDYEFEAAKRQAEHQITEEEARERIANGEFSTDVEPFMSDEQKSNALLREQEEREDRLFEEQLAREAEAKKKTDYSKLDGAPKPFKPRRLPSGATQYNGFPENEKGEMYDDGFSFDEIDHDDEFGD